MPSVRQLISRPLVVIGAILALTALLAFVVVVRMRSLAGTTQQTANTANAAPSVDAVVPSDASGSGDVSLPAAGFNLNEGTPRTLYVRGTVSDPNGCSDLAGVSVKVYRSGVTAGAACTSDNNDCYAATVTIGQLAGCTGAGDNDATFETSVQIANYADPTDAGSPHDSETWLAQATVSDVADLSSTLSTPFEMLSLAAFSISPTLINYGTIALGATSSPQALAFANTGNRQVDSLVRAGSDMTSSLSGFADITSTQTHYSMNSGSAWTAGTPVALSDSPLPLGLTQQVADAGPVPSVNAYFLLKLPTSGIRGTYSNTLYFTANTAVVETSLTLGSISPGRVQVGGAQFVLNLTGSGFVPGSQVKLDGANRATTYVDGAHLTATILATDLASAGTRAITVTNPAPDGDTTVSRTLTVSTALTNGLPAATVIGQLDNSITGGSQVPNFAGSRYNGGANRYGFESPNGVAIDTVGHHLFLSSDSRIQVYDLDLSNNLVDNVPDQVLGQGSFYSYDTITARNRLNVPMGLAWDAAGHRLFVADSENSRVLEFNLAGGVTSGMNAEHVLGQSDFLGSDGDLSDSAMSAPSALAYDEGSSRLFVADSGNNRILEFGLSGGITDGMSADHVLGQANFGGSDCESPTTSFGACDPRGLYWDQGAVRLFVADSDNHRVLEFNLSGGIADGMAAEHVLGQPDFGASSVSQSASSMFWPQGLAYNSSTSSLFVADTDNNRVLQFNLSSGVADGMDAEHVLGQEDFGVSDRGTSDVNLSQPNGLVWESISERLYVADVLNNRVLVFGLDGGVANGMAADGVIGQFEHTNFGTVPSVPSFVAGGPNNSPNAWGFGETGAVAVDPVAHRLFVSDSDGYRVLVYDLQSDNTMSDYVADHVLGKPNLYSIDNITSRDRLRVPDGLAWDAAGHRLFVADAVDNRIMVYDLSGGIVDGMNASHVLGQIDFDAFYPDVTAGSMSLPGSLAWDASGHRLFVTDGRNNRVLEFNLSSGIVDGMNASHVLGQANFSSRSDAATASGMSFPNGLAWDAAGNRLFVGDSGNNRVTEFDLSSGIEDGMDASQVLGQMNLDSASRAAGANGMSFPGGISWDAAGQRLFVADGGNNRVLEFGLSSGVANGMDAERVLGQEDFDSSAGGTSATQFQYPFAVNYDTATAQLYVSEIDNNRVTVFDLP